MMSWDISNVGYVSSSSDLFLNATNSTNINCDNFYINATSSMTITSPIVIVDGRPLISASYTPGGFPRAPPVWAGTPPTNLQDAMDRLADAFYLFTGMTPIP